MEIKARLTSPYTEEQRMDFIVQYNHNLGYQIEEDGDDIVAYGETEEELHALGYCYDAITKEFIDTVKLSVDREASIRTGKTVYLIPANCTTKKPSDIQEYEINIFENEEWVVKKDYRNCWIVNSTMIPEQVKEIGDLKDGFIVITEEQKAEIELDKDLYIIKKGKLVKNPDYDTIKAQEREANFNNNFIITSQGAYRLKPQGFANAQQAMDFTDKMIEKIGFITEQIASNIIFYTVPDFTIAEQCTEEWLVAHQTTWTSTSLEDWSRFYVEFGMLYVQKMYREQ